MPHFQWEDPQFYSVLYETIWFIPLNYDFVNFLLPFSAANIKANWSLSVLTLAPLWMSKSTVAKCPCLAAIEMAVWPSLSLALISAPFWMTESTSSFCPKQENDFQKKLFYYILWPSAVEITIRSSPHQWHLKILVHFTNFCIILTKWTYNFNVREKNAIPNWPSTNTI